jgi:hypothetical protein
MTTEVFTEKRLELLQLKKEQMKAVDLDYTDLCNDFILNNSPVKNLEVYELLENGNKRRGFKRFIIYEQEVQTFGNSPMIKVGGWWLNSDNVPTKWDSMTVFGCGNPAIFKLSDNQTHSKHPDSTDVE